MIAPFGPAPEMVSKETSRSGICVSSPVCAAGSPRACVTTAISSSVPGAWRSSQHSNFAIAAPSRRCAARAPAISALFLVARGRRAGSVAETTVPPLSRPACAASRRPAPDRARSSRRPSPSPPDLGLERRRRAAGRQAASDRLPVSIGSLRLSMKSSCAPSAASMAKPSASGVCGTSPPRMLKVQASEDGSVSTACVAPSLAIAAASRASLSLASSPANSIGWISTGASGGVRPVGPQFVDRVGVERQPVRRRSFRPAPSAP